MGIAVLLISLYVIPSRTLSRRPHQSARNLLRGEAYGAAGMKETIWALKDVSFEVKRCFVMGIIGHNGNDLLESGLVPIISLISLRFSFIHGEKYATSFTSFQKGRTGHSTKLQ